MTAAAAAALIAGAARADSAPAAPPPLTELTVASGGAMIPEQSAVTLEHVDLAIRVQPDSRSIVGVATLELIAKAPLTTVVLDLDRNLPVAGVKVDGRALKPGAWSNPEGRLRIKLPRPARAGAKLAVEIAYGGVPHVAVKAPWDGGFVWAKTKDGQPWVATAVQGEGCDLLWPCIDHPQGEPVSVDLHVTVPPGLAAPANGVLRGIETGADGWRTYHWRARNPDTYAISLNVGPFVLMEGEYKSKYGNTIPLQLWRLPEHAEEAKGLFAEMSEMLQFFEDAIGPYPFGDEKFGVVETPHKGMEHQTINAYGNEYARDVYGFDWLMQHEFAHEWFGNQLTNVDWDDFWLHEGFGSYMQPLYGEYRRGDMAYMAMLQRLRGLIRSENPMVTGTARSEHAVDDAKTGPGQDVYNKGAWMLHTLRGLIGDDAFFEATRRLVYGRPDPAPGNFTPRYASTRDFMLIVNQVTGRDLTWFFDVYLYEAALPDLVAERQGDQLLLRWKTPHDKPFPLPVEVKVGSEIRTVAMTGGEGRLTVPADARITLDPRAKVLRRLPEIEALLAWQDKLAAERQAAQKAKAEAEKAKAEADKAKADADKAKAAAAG